VTVRSGLADEKKLAEADVSERIRKEYNEETRTGFEIYNELFDEEYVYLKSEGFPFEATCMPVSETFPAVPTVVLKFPREWAKKLGIIANEHGSYS
jgi:hypothetical protein